MLVTSAAVSDSVGLRLQERIGALTVWLVILTVLLLGLGTATLVLEANPPRPIVQVPRPVVHINVTAPTNRH